MPLHNHRKGGSAKSGEINSFLITVRDTYLSTMRGEAVIMVVKR